MGEGFGDSVMCGAVKELWNTDHLVILARPSAFVSPVPSRLPGIAVGVSAECRTNEKRRKQKLEGDQRVRTDWDLEQGC